MKLSPQAMGALMLALQNSILEQSDIVPVLQDFDFQLDQNELLIVSNPPKGKTLEEFSNVGKTEELDA
jgi:hypothetical protein